jgi:hypothetical protein
MTVTEMVRSLGKNVFLPLVALCMVGVFSFVCFADEATTDKPATGGAIERAAEATERGLNRAANATERGVKRGANATKRGVNRAGKATGKGIKKGGEAVEKTFSGTDSAKEQPQQQ